MPKLLHEIKKFYKKEGRSHLPWRSTHDPYKILVSEIMLQQTQVERVVPFYNRFVRQFPTARALARAKLSTVLKALQGLGYNRRAKYLWESAKILSEAKDLGGGSRGRVYLSRSRASFAERLEALPGVGPYTARAVVAFAYNKPEVFIETNIRTAFLYFCFKKRSVVSDKEILPLVAEALTKSKMEPREFYWALMDYGSYLKQNGVKLNARSKHYTKQSKFEGSARQLRGAILRELLKKPHTFQQLIKKFSPAKSRGEVERELIRLQQEDLVDSRRGRYAIAAV